MKTYAFRSRAGSQALLPGAASRAFRLRSEDDGGETNTKHRLAGIRELSAPGTASREAIPCRVDSRLSADQNSPGLRADHAASEQVRILSDNGRAFIAAALVPAIMIAILSFMPVAVSVIGPAVIADTTVTFSGVNGNGRKRLADRTARSGFLGDAGGAATGRWRPGFGSAGAGPGAVFGKRVIRRRSQGDSGHEHRKNPARYGEAFKYLHQLSSCRFAARSGLLKNC